MEVKLTEMVVAKPPTINFDELKAAATDFADKYKGLVITSENVADGKIACAEQRKTIEDLKALKTQVNKKAKEIVAPVIAKIDELISIVEPTYLELRKQVVEIADNANRVKHDKALDEATKKTAEAFPHYQGAVKHIELFVEERCAAKKGGWLTKTATEKVIGAEIDAEIQRMKSEFDFLKNHLKDKSDDVKRFAASSFVNLRFDAKAAIVKTDEYIATCEEMRRAEEERKAAETPKVPVTEPVAKPTAKEGEGDKFYAVLKFVGTRDELVDIKKFVSERGYAYEVVEQGKVTKE